MAQLIVLLGMFTAPLPTRIMQSLHFLAKSPDKLCILNVFKLKLISFTERINFEQVMWTFDNAGPNICAQLYLLFNSHYKSHNGLLFTLNSFEVVPLFNSLFILIPKPFGLCDKLGAIRHSDQIDRGFFWFTLKNFKVSIIKRPSEMLHQLLFDILMHLFHCDWLFCCLIA